jgi:RNase P/RNase MRP subunit POP5
MVGEGTLGPYSNTVVVALIFNRAAMKKRILLCPLTVTGVDEKINLQYQKNLAWRDSKPKDSIY